MVVETLHKIKRGLPVASAILKGLKIRNSERAIKAIAAVKYIDALLNALINGEEIPDAPDELTKKQNG